MGYTQEQVQQNFALAQKMILPARLKDVITTGHRLTAHMLDKQIDPTAEGFVKAFNNLLEEIPWDVKPAKLLAIEANKRPIRIKPAQDSSNDFAARVRAGETADAKAKAEAQFEKSVLDAIASFFPLTKRGQLDHRKQTEVQTLLRDYVAKEKARSVSMDAVREKVMDYIRDEYEQIEKSMERV